MEKILLGVMPYWDPLIPPQGIARLKKYLGRHGYSVSIIDANVVEEFKQKYDEYFAIIKKNVPEDNYGNLYSIGHFVLQNHLMAHFNYKNENDYYDLVKILVAKTFFVEFSNPAIKELIDTISGFYDDFKKYLLKTIEQHKPDIFGLTFTTGTLPASTFALKFVKELYPEIITMMGGGIFADQFAENSPNYNYFLEYSKDFIDKIIIGQGELLFLKILKKEFPSSQRVFTLKDINYESVGFKDQGNPDLTDYFLELYPYMGATGSVSCKHQCSFCNAAKFYGQYREKDVKQTVDEMIELFNLTGNQLFFMTDSMLNLIVDDFSNEFVKRDESVYWDAYFRVDDPSAVITNSLKWRRGGFYRARIGVESGSQKILDSISKEIQVEQTKATLASLAYAGIKTTTYWVIGHPGETEEDFQQTLALLEESKNNIWQAECAQFDYYYDGQSNSDKWANIRILLYPEKYSHMLVSRSWILNCDPTREETYKRIFRFVRRCKELGIPNPYSLNEIYKADARWKKLHKNAVPSLIELKRSKQPITENKALKQLSLATIVSKQYDDAFNF